MSHPVRPAPPLVGAEAGKGRSMRPRGAALRAERSPGPCLGHADALTLLEIIHGCVRCDCEVDFRRLFQRLQGLLPFEHACAVLGRGDDRRGVVVEHIVNLSCLEQFMDECRERNYLQRSELAREHFRSFGLKFWVEARRRLAQPTDLVSMALDLGMRSGYTLGAKPLPAARHGSMFCLSVPSVRRDERTEAILELVVPHLHFALCRLYDGQRRDAEGIRLSAREKDILRLMMQGKSSWDMSIIIGISESTVNYHVYNVMQKLEAINRPQAVAVAARLGLVEVE
jgi:DNA-binding CsgD family transcriptional regulator